MTILDFRLCAPEVYVFENPALFILPDNAFLHSRYPKDIDLAFVLTDALANFLPMTSTATPVSAAAKQQHQNNDNEDQFHSKSP
jgi:hypothetical protein